MIDQLLKRNINNQYPELTGQLHLSLWGRVHTPPKSNSEPQPSTPETPRYAIDVEVLDETGESYQEPLILKDVPLPATGSGDQRGVFAFPQAGTIVELGFVYGLPNRPFIRSIFIEEKLIPALNTTDVLIQRDDNNFYRFDQEDNLTEHCKKIATRIADVQQRLEVKEEGTVWVGNESINIVRVLDDLIQLTQRIATTLASHTHGYTDDGKPATTKAPDQAGDFSGQGSSAGGLHDEIMGMVAKPNSG
ncbi:hypothetical protein [Marinibactrum halimedae]|uniref:Gp5/Type VI secretion system Vgr protein OB-fold domain-containing protein n=1 Tax=Marinibactrum halimedae TaxID=1444977 RepID=A0AA37WM83_9GAMM|nr:hypothetical protein [Marinibactrum halimedae]MCD9458451.1 hypothetical protein [Marinibactrum halimedae]GLS26148.1 hypothetical protein GCM10007877_18630 [Marinibactrum halimedae]